MNEDDVLIMIHTHVVELYEHGLKRQSKFMIKAGSGEWRRKRGEWAWRRDGVRHKGSFMVPIIVLFYWRKNDKPLLILGGGHKDLRAVILKLYTCLKKF